MHGDEEIAHAREEAARMNTVRLDDVAIESLRSDSSELFDQLPEPPMYRRTDDPIRARARQLSERATRLLTRGLSLQEAGNDPRLDVLIRSLESHLRALLAMTRGDITAGESLWREARDSQRGHTEVGQMWRRAAAPIEAKVYDRETGESRYDPRPEPVVTMQLVCPNTCRKIATYGLSPRSATNRLVCSNCHQPFTAFLAEARSVETVPQGTALHYSVLVDEMTPGVERRIDFSDSSGADLALAPRDAVAFLYGRQETLDAVMNLSTGRVLFVVAPGRCFIATAVYGADAEETRALRRFRDRSLIRTRSGRAAVHAYYFLSPPLAAALGRTPRLRKLVRCGLDVVVRKVR
jgi:hypothetical protein